MTPSFRSISASNRSQKIQINLEQLGEMLQWAWDEGKITHEVHDAIQLGLLPIQLIQEQLGIKIERSTSGEGLLSVTRI
ncbi:hypothetical protein IPJ72_06910 [Candidatus Peregrinibacteria bacterium]|nr:MAG: hypothetical protein IPJ72_06910 [Candidatus Peregrinibacteria bacterium]